MRYVVKIGEDLDLVEAPERAGENVTIQVNVGAKTDEKKNSSVWKVGIVGFLVFCALVVTPPVAYGMATGDFSFLASVAGYFTDLMAALVKAAISALDKK